MIEELVSKWKRRNRQLAWKWKRKDFEWKRKNFDWKRLIKKLDLNWTRLSGKLVSKWKRMIRRRRIYALELRKLEAAEREQIRKHGLRTQGIRVDEVGHTEDTDSFRMSAAIKFVPKFQEQDLEQF